MVTDQRVEGENLHVSFATLKGQSDSGESHHSGEELFYVVEGCVDLIIGEGKTKEKYPLQMGDVAHYNPNVVHTVRNPQKQPAKVLVVRWPAH